MSVVIFANTGRYTVGTPILFTIIVSSPTSIPLTDVIASSTPIGTPMVISQSAMAPATGVPVNLVFYATLTAPSSLTDPNTTFTFTVVVGGSVVPTSPVILSKSNTIVVTKTANTSAYATGQVIGYNYLIQNASAAPVTITSVTDNKAGVATVNGILSVPIPVGGSVVYKANYTATAADTTTGSIFNTANVSSTAGFASASLTVFAAYPASLSNPNIVNGAIITKSASPSSFTAAGMSISYTYTVTNMTYGAAQTLGNATLIDSNSSVTGITGPSSIAPGATAIYTGTYVTTAADVATGYITNLGEFYATAGTVGTNFIATPAYSGLVITLSLVCIHSTSRVWYTDVEGKGKTLREVSDIKDGDYVLGADGKPAKVVEVVTCRDRHPESKTPHTCVVFPPDSIKDGVPSHLFVVDPGHPIGTPESFSLNGMGGLVPAGWYLQQEGKYTGVYKSDWSAITKKLGGTSLRYDLILEMTSCGAYLANDVPVQARWTVGRPNYWHDADE